jgi:hypothetical protein
LLPERAAERLRLLRQRRADAHRLIPEFETIREASMARIDADNALKRLTAHQQEFGKNLPETDPLVVAAKKHLDKMTADFRRLTELQEVRSGAFQSASAALANVEAWLRDGRPHGTVLEDYDGEMPKLLKGDNGLLDAVERLRRRGRELRADQHRTRSAPFPSAYAKQQMREQIEALAMQGALSVSLLIEHDGKIEFQTQRLTSEVHAAQRALAFTEVPNTLALIAWLHRDLLIKRLDELITDESDDGAALSHEQRQQRESEVQGDLLDIERQEATLTWSAMEQGLPVEFRSDLDPRAILKIQLISTPRADAFPETSPGFSWPWRQ